MIASEQRAFAVVREIEVSVDLLVGLLARLAVPEAGWDTVARLSDIRTKVGEAVLIAQDGVVR
jgi:hypothetical protein